MADQLQVTKLLSLKEMAQLSWIVHLYSDPKILASVLRYQRLEGCEEYWQTIENKIKDKILKLFLPKSLLKQMVDVVRPIGLEIRRWKQFYEWTYDFSIFEILRCDSSQLYFTPTGIIDDRRMAEQLVLCKSISVVQRYKIACSHWLEDHIPALWSQLSEFDKEYFYKNNPALQGLEFSWPRIFNGRESNLDRFLRGTDRYLTSFNQWAFEHSAKIRYKTAADCFFRKLTHEEREASLMRSSRAIFLHRVDGPEERLYDVFSHLLSLMTPKQRIEIVKACPLGVMSCFLYWPRQDLFLENAALIWPFLPPRVFGHLLQKMLKRLSKDHLAEFFPDFYQQSPLDFKNFFVHGKDGALVFLYQFFNSEDPESIKVMFRSLDVVDRGKVVFQRHILDFFHGEMLKDKWHLVKVCLQEAVVSRDDRKRLKETFLRYLEAGYFTNPLYPFYLRRMDMLQSNASDPKFESFFHFLDASDDEEKKDQGRKLGNCWFLGVILIFLWSLVLKYNE